MNSDLYATLHKIKNMNPIVPDVYVNLSQNIADHKITVHLKNRIPLSSFFTLFNYRFFTNWNGKMSIEICPSYRNLVIAPVIQDEAINMVIKLTKKHTDTGNCELDKIKLGF